jgi:hypothetical protein
MVKWSPWGGLFQGQAIDRRRLSPQRKNERLWSGCYTGFRRRRPYGAEIIRFTLHRLVRPADRRFEIESESMDDYRERGGFEA